MDMVKKLPRTDEEVLPNNFWCQRCFSHKCAFRFNLRRNFKSCRV